MSTQRIIRLAQYIEQKYAQQDPILNVVLTALNAVVNSPIQIGKDKAQEVLQYLQEKQSANFQDRQFVDASYLDKIIANMVYSKVPDRNIVYYIQMLLKELSTQKTNFGVSNIQNTIDRYKRALNHYKGDASMADEWSRSGVALHDFQPQQPTKIV